MARPYGVLTPRPGAPYHGQAVPTNFGRAGLTDRSMSTPPLPATPRQARLILFLGFPGMCMLDIAGPQTVFWCASKIMQERGLPGYERHTVSLDGGMVLTLEGVGMQTGRLDDFALEQVDTILVPGAPDIVAAVARHGALVDQLRSRAPATRRMASVCTGAFVLAAAGLLDGKRAATHWLMHDLLGQTYPRVEVDREAIFVQHGDTWTSGGVTAGIDLALAMVEQDCGREVALAVARELVVFVKRPSGQPQLSSMLQAQARDGPLFDKLHLWILANLGSAQLDVEALAEPMQMSPRNFTRVYKDKTGQTPARAVERFRLEAACRLLEDSARHIDQIALECGFGDEGRMRETFQRQLQLSPSAYRQRPAAGQAGAAPFSAPTGP